jgi:hypothetical protein
MWETQTRGCFEFGICSILFYSHYARALSVNVMLPDPLTGKPGWVNPPYRVDALDITEDALPVNVEPSDTFRRRILVDASVAIKLSLIDAPLSVNAVQTVPERHALNNDMRKK